MIVPVRARGFSREAEWYRAISVSAECIGIPQGRFFDIHGRMRNLKQHEPGEYPGGFCVDYIHKKSSARKGYKKGECGTIMEVMDMAAEQIREKYERSYFVPQEMTCP